MKKLFAGVNLSDRITVPSKRTMTDAGQMIVPCSFARTGTLIYKAGDLGLVDENPDKLIKVLRLDDEVFSEDSMNTFRSAPLTLGHPVDADGNKVAVTSDNAKELQVGFLEGMPTRDEDLLTGNLVIANKEAIDYLNEGNKELSAGYACDLYEDSGEYFQKNIKANHIAIVPKGRAGSACSISDEADIGKHDDVPDSNFDDKQLADGIKVEMEHTDSVAIAKSIAKDHLTEDSDYYIKLATIEDEADEPSAIKDISDGFVPQEKADTATIIEDQDKSEQPNWKSDFAKGSFGLYTDLVEGGDNSLATEYVAYLRVADEALAELETKVTAKEVLVTDSVNTQISALLEVIVVGKEMCDNFDYSTQNLVQMKSDIVTDVTGADLTGKPDAYIEARYDIMLEDSKNETPMARLLKKQVNDSVAEEVYKDPVAEARKRSIERNKHK